MEGGCVDDKRDEVGYRGAHTSKNAFKEMFRITPEHTKKNQKEHVSFLNRKIFCPMEIYIIFFLSTGHPAEQ